MKQQAKTLWIKAVNIELIATLVTFVILYSLMFNVVVTSHLLLLAAIPLFVSYLVMRTLVNLSHPILAFKNERCGKSIKMFWFSQIICTFASLMLIVY